MTIGDHETLVGYPGDATSAVEYNEESETYRTTFGRDTSVAEAVVAAAGRARGVEPLELPPLFPAVDPDALDALVGPTPVDRDRTAVTVTFEYAGCVVSVSDDGSVVVEPPR